MHTSVRARVACVLFDSARRAVEKKLAEVSEGIARAAEVNAEARMTDACRRGVRRFLDKSDRA